MSARSGMDAELADLYAQVPDIPDCTGECWTSCGPIDMSRREGQRIRSAGYRITPHAQARALNRGAKPFWCEALTADKRCAVYEMRPMICRLWGTARMLACPYGCIPEGGFLSDERFYVLLLAAMRAGGTDLPGVAEMGDEGLREMALFLAGQAAERGSANQKLVALGLPAAFGGRQ